MNEISGRMNTIIIKGLLVSSNDTGTHVREIFTIDRLESLVGVALEEYIFEEVGPDIQKWFFSEHCNLGMCTNVISAGDAIYSCLECQQHDMCVLCENCFMSSQHVNHDCQSKKAKHTGQVCSCGVKDLWKCHSTCTSHSTPQIPTKELPASFMSKFKLVVQYFCELLEKVCNHDQSILDKHVEKMIRKPQSRTRNWKRMNQLN
ncbi:E3 ubiquitin-protein ligase UBR1 [Thelohanellus kitauei]|uniref:E3 ubiquitin-protein ligase n=1 Tax=Thelohanellus kitauei TaxID=669202 RepID=A0A0C2NKK1_THEKT|nr:E3 ubiquitin-protein ligase UBR1 [Thelohanellus kitauei]